MRKHKSLKEGSCPECNEHTCKCCLAAPAGCSGVNHIKVGKGWLERDVASAGAIEMTSRRMYGKAAAHRNSDIRGAFVEDQVTTTTTPS